MRFIKDMSWVVVMKILKVLLESLVEVCKISWMIFFKDIGKGYWVTFIVVLCKVLVRYWERYWKF